MSDRWQLTAESLEALLDVLGPDRRTAAASYERIRARLVRLFQWKGCRDPEELVDETLDRVAAKLAEGLEIQSDNPYHYVVGVANRLFHEVLRRHLRERRGLEALRKEPDPAPPSSEDERRLQCLDECLETLGDDRGWILTFYQGEKGVRIRMRKDLAEQMGITVNALRIRAHRLRAKLEACVRLCVRQNVAGGD